MMKVQYTRAHVGGGAFGSLLQDVKVDELPDTTDGAPTPVPTGGTQVDANTPARDWQTQAIAPQEGS